ncbi:MAG: hypothetical protein WAO61_05770 [Solirubrobacterales bacterium]
MPPEYSICTPARTASNEQRSAFTLAGVAWKLTALVFTIFALLALTAPASNAADNAGSASAGAYHSCAVTSSGGAKCWGNNSYGQLGDGTTTNRSAPVDVAGLGSGVVQISAGYYSTCALTTTGGVKCWGYGFQGQLGNGGYGNTTTPTDVIGLTTGVESISSGANHTCAVTTTGGAKCWGHAAFGQVGDGASGSVRLTPVDVSGLGSGVESISAGGYHTCAVTDTGGAKCWGRGVDGQIGNGSYANQSTPADVSGFTANVESISAGMRHTCLAGSGAGDNVYCWGRGNEGQLGDGAGTTSNVPVLAPIVATSVSAGLAHTCAVTPAQSLECWGAGSYGQLGNGATANALSPTPVTGFPDGSALSVSAGGYHTCAIDADNGVSCWGYRNYGQLGSGSLTDQLVPVGVAGLTAGPGKLSLGDSHSCAATVDDTAKCWGQNSLGQLGTGGGSMQTVPVTVTGLISDTKTIGAGAKHTCAVTLAGAAQCWGKNTSGQLGNGGASDAMFATPVTGLASGVEQIDGADYHSCALTSSGGVKCWGSGSSGSLGTGSNASETTPQDVSGLTSDVSAISVGGRHSCALTTAGGVKCWGYNAFGQLGDGTTTNSNVPVDVTGLTSGVAAISVGGLHTCAITTAGALKCWGYGRAGQLGVGSIADSSTPVAVIGMTSQTASISTGYQHTCATRTNGVLLCWGSNRSGQLGVGTYNKHSKATRVAGFEAGGATSVVAGRDHTCAVTTDNAAKCWGNGGSGQLGYGSLSSQSTPVDVLGFAGD